MKMTAIVVNNASKNKSLPLLLMSFTSNDRAGVAENLVKAGAAR